MSKNVFNSKNLGEYYFFLHYIELNDEVMMIPAQRASQVVLQQTNNLSAEEILFLKTYLHETTHLLDSSASIWGIEYSIRLINCLNDMSNTKPMEVFATNHSEIELHTDLLLSNEREYFEYREMRSVLSYDTSHGVHLQFHYYNNKHILSHKTPVSMLSVLEGHAFAVEQLKEIEIYENKNDIVSLKLLERAYLKTLHNPLRTEYTCLLAFSEQIYPSKTFKEKLIILDFTCRFCLNIPSIGFPFPSYYIDGLFRNSDEKLVSSLKMDLSRGMNRSSLLCLILIVLKYSFDEIQINEDDTFESQVEDRVFDIFRRGNQTLKQCKQSLLSLWEVEYDLGCKLLDEKGFELANKLAILNKGYSWNKFDHITAALPEVGLVTGSFINAKNPIKFDMEQHFYKYSDAADQLIRSLQNINKKKQHLNPNTAHAWLNDINEGKNSFIKFYDE